MLCAGDFFLYLFNVCWLLLLDGWMNGPDVLTEFDVASYNLPKRLPNTNMNMDRQLSCAGLTGSYNLHIRYLWFCKCRFKNQQ